MVSVRTNSKEDNAIAIKHYNKILSLNKNHEGALCSRGMSLSDMGQLEDAITDLQKAVVLCNAEGKEGCAKVYSRLAITKYRLYKTDRDRYKHCYTEALTHLTEGLAICKDDACQMILNNIGYLHLSLNDVPQAKEYLIKGFKSGLNNDEQKLIYYNLGLCNLLIRTQLF